MITKVISKGCTLTIGTAYIPANRNERRVQLETIPLLSNNKDNQILAYDIIAGDWNDVKQGIDRDTNAQPPEQFKEGMLNTLDFLSGNKSDRHFINGQRTAYLELREYTYYIYNRGVSRINRIYVREDQFYRTTDWEIAPKPLMLDYRPVEFKLRVNPNATTRKGQGRQRLNLGILAYLRNVEKCKRLLGRTEELGGGQSTFKRKVKDHLSTAITT